MDRIGDACHQIVLSFSVTLKGKPLIDPTIQYDIFISYSHSDSERANHIVKYLKALNPDLRLFFDMQELKTGRYILHRCRLKIAINISYDSFDICDQDKI